jgi:uncharacterized membrane protein
MKGLLKGQLSILIYGFVFWLPLVVVIYVMVVMFGGIDKLGKDILLLGFSENAIHTGMGFLLFIIIVYLTGILFKLKRVKGWLSRLPLIGFLFGRGEVISVARLTNLQPCLFLFSPTCISYGWILSEEVVKFNEKFAPFNLVSVYYPNVPTLITGQVFVARKDTVMKLDNSSSEIIDLLLYSFRSPPSLKYIPWEDESPKDFEQRAAFFGLKTDDKPKAL